MSSFTASSNASIDDHQQFRNTSHAVVAGHDELSEAQRPDFFNEAWAQDAFTASPITPLSDYVNFEFDVQTNQVGYQSQYSQTPAILPALFFPPGVDVSRSDDQQNHQSICQYDDADALSITSCTVPSQSLVSCRSLASRVYTPSEDIQWSSSAEPHIPMHTEQPEQHIEGFLDTVSAEPVCLTTGQTRTLEQWWGEHVDDPYLSECEYPGSKLDWWWDQNGHLTTVHDSLKAASAVGDLATPQLEEVTGTEVRAQLYHAFENSSAFIRDLSVKHKIGQSTVCHLYVHWLQSSDVEDVKQHEAERTNSQSSIPTPIRAASSRTTETISTHRSSHGSTSHGPREGLKPAAQSHKTWSQSAWPENVMTSSCPIPASRCGATQNPVQDWSISAPAQKRVVPLAPAKDVQSLDPKANPMPMPDARPTPKGVYKCTQCSSSFTRRTTLKRHVDSIHESRTVWICEPRPDVLKLSSLESKHSRCFSRPESDRVFCRKDYFIQHLHGVHLVSKDVIKTLDLAIWERQGEGLDFSKHCQWCGLLLESVEAKVQHETRHGNIRQPLFPDRPVSSVKNPRAAVVSDPKEVTLRQSPLNRSEKRRHIIKRAFTSVKKNFSQQKV